MSIDGFPKKSNIVENWLFDFENQSGASFFISFSDDTYNSNFYHGVITNSPTIRESIDLKKSISKSGNLSLTIPNFTYKGKPVSEELYGGSNYYINRSVTVRSRVNNLTPIVIGVFRLVNISTNGDSLSLSLVSQRPWDFISFPQTKHPDYPIYEPVVYGSYTPSSGANTANDNYSTYGGVFPVSVLYFSTDKVYTIMPRSYTTSDNAFIHKYAGFNQFIPLRLSAGVFSNEGKRVDSITSTSIDNSGLNILGSRLYEFIGDTEHLTAFEGYMATAPSDKDVIVTLFSNQQNMFKRNVDGSFDTSVGATVLFSSGGLDRYCLIATPPKELFLDNISKVLMEIKVSVSTDQNHNHDFFGARFDNTDDDLLSSPIQRAYDNNYSSGTGEYSTTTGAFSFDASPSNSIASNRLVASDELLIKISSIASGIFSSHTMTIGSLQLFYSQSVPYFDGSDTSPSGTELYKEKDIGRIQEIKTFYCGGNGLKASWSGTPDITEIHEAHRDLLIRFAGMGTSTPNGYGNGSDGLLDHIKDWKIRYWRSEPSELKKELERLQYEGGFIFRYKNGDTTEPQYIFIRDTYSGVTHIDITKDDLKNVDIEPDGYDSLISKMTVNYQKHPAERGYLFQSTAENSTVRSNYNVATKENIVEVNLDAYSSPEIPTSPSSNPNDDFYTYYDNIFGDIKINISGTIVNPSLYKIDVGDTVTFSDMYPEKAFGKSFSGVIFMITSLSRTRGSLKFKAREIA
jgi:hypothetical protein